MMEEWNSILAKNAKSNNNNNNSGTCQWHVN
jgi:hypothetical protein